MSGFINDASSKVGDIQSFDDINIKTDTVLINNTDLNFNTESLNAKNGSSNDLVDLTDLIGDNKTLYNSSNNNINTNEITELGTLSKEEYQSELKKVEDYYSKQLKYLNGILSDPNKDGIQDQLDEINNAIKTINDTEARSIYNTNADLDAFVKKTIPKIMEKYNINSYQELVDLQKQLNNATIEINQQINTINNQKESAKYDYLDFLKDYNDFQEKGIDNNKLQKLDSESTITYTTEISDDKMTKNYSFREYKKLYPDITPLEYYNLVKEKNKDGNFTITGIEEYTTFQYLMEIKDAAPELAKRYDYLSNISQEEADEFLRKCAYEINNIKGQLEAKEFLDSLKNADEKTILAALNNEFDVHKQGLADGVVSFLEGLLHTADASASLIEKLGNKIGFIEEAAHENRVMAPSEYKKMYILQALQSGEYKGLALSNNYEISQGIGNMLPSIAISAFTPYGSIAMGLSSGGNAYHSSMTQGHGFFSSLVNGVYNGTSEAITEKLFGGLPGLGNVKVTGLKTYLKAVKKEGITEVIQGVMDSLYQAAFMGESLPTTFEEWKAYAKDIAKQGAYGAITAGYTQAPSLIVKSISKNYAKAKSKQETLKSTYSTKVNPTVDESVDLTAAVPQDIEAKKYTDSPTPEPVSANDQQSPTIDESVDFSNIEDQKTDIKNSEESTIEPREYKDSATEEKIESDQSEEPKAEEIQFRNEESEISSIKENWKNFEQLQQLLKNKSSEEIETIFSSTEMTNFINEMGQYDCTVFMVGVVKNMDSNIEVPRAILERVVRLEPTYLATFLVNINTNKPLVDINNPNNIGILFNINDAIGKADRITELEAFLNGKLFDPSATEVSPRVESLYEDIKRTAEYRKSHILSEFLKNAGYTRKVGNVDTAIEYEINCTLNGEETTIKVPISNGELDFYQIFKDPVIDYACKSGNFKIISIEPTAWSFDGGIPTGFTCERLGQEYDFLSDIPDLEAAASQPYKLEIELKDGIKTLYIMPDKISSSIGGSKDYSFHFSLYEFLNNYGINAWDVKNMKVSKISPFEIKFDDFRQYRQSKTYKELFNDSVYGGDQSDVYNYVKRFLSGESKSNIEAKKSKILINEVKKFFSDATDEQISDISYAYAENGCGYMTYANSLMLFFGNLENGEQLFREKFGFDLYVEDGGQKSYNVEALAFNLYLQNASTMSSDINIAMKECGGTFTDVKYNTWLYDYLKSKGITTTFNSTIIDQAGMSAKYKYLKAKLAIANSLGFFHTLRSINFSLFGAFTLEESADRALKNTSRVDYAQHNIGSHRMLITDYGWGDQIRVSSWKTNCLFPVEIPKDFRIDSFKFKLEGE